MSCQSQTAEYIIDVLMFLRSKNHLETPNFCTLPAQHLARSAATSAPFPRLGTDDTCRDRPVWDTWKTKTQTARNGQRPRRDPSNTAGRPRNGQGWAYMECMGYASLMECLGYMHRLQLQMLHVAVREPSPERIRDRDLVPFFCRSMRSVRKSTVSGK